MADIAPSQRDAIKQLSPPWLATGFSEKFLYNIGLGADALLEKLNQAMKAHMPTLCDPTALPYLGADRLMGQGPNESNANFRLRLKKAFDTWQNAGSRRSVLQQVLGYVANQSTTFATKMPLGAIVSTSGPGNTSTWDVFYSDDDTTKAPHHRLISGANWNWDGVNPWWNAFLVLYFPIVLSTTTGAAGTLGAVSGGMQTVTGLTGMSTSSLGQFLVVTGAANSSNNGTFQIAQYISATSVKIANSNAVANDANAVTWTLGYFPAIAPAPAWGTPGRVWGDTTMSWGLNVTSGYIQALQGLVRLWKSAQTFYPWIIISFAETTGGGTGPFADEFSPNSVQGTGNPDGTWGTWAKTVNGVSVPARNSGIGISRFDAFCDGTAVYQSCFAPTGT